MSVLSPSPILISYVIFLLSVRSLSRTSFSVSSTDLIVMPYPDASPSMRAFMDHVFSSPPAETVSVARLLSKFLSVKTAVNTLVSLK